MSDFVKSTIYEAEGTKNLDRNWGGSPDRWEARAWVIRRDGTRYPILMTAVMMREGRQMAERNPEDCGVWLPPPVPAPRQPEQPAMPTWLQWFVITAAIAAGYALRAVG